MERRRRSQEATLRVAARGRNTLLHGVGNDINEPQIHLHRRAQRYFGFPRERFKALGRVDQLQSKHRFDRVEHSRLGCNIAHLSLVKA